MSDLLNYGDLEADYVLTEEEEQALRSEESMAQIQQRVEAERAQQMQRDADLQALEQAPATPQQQTPTGEQPQQQAPADATAQQLSGETVTFDNGKTYAVEHIEYRNGVPFVKPEFNDLYQEGQGSIFGQDPSEFAQQVRERTSALGQGLFDFGAQLANKFLPASAKIPTATKYEDKVAQAVRQISSVVTPTIGLTSLGMQAGQLAQARVGWSLGNTAFMRFLGARGVEAAAGTVVGAVSSEYEGDNLTGSIKKMLPAQWDFIPDNWATLDTDSPDIKRQKNINEDLALGFIIPFVGSARKFSSAVGEVNELFSKGNAFTKPNQVLPVITAESAQAAKFIEEAKPSSAITTQARKLWNDAYQGGEVSRSWDELDEITQQSTIQRFIDERIIDEDIVDLTSYALKQDEALDELGMYNLSQNPNMDVALKGVHDLYDWNEIGMRTVDDFGIVGASIDAVRIAKNYDTTYGRIGNFVSPPVIKYAGTNPLASEEIVMGLTKQLKDADQYGMEAANWSIKFDDVVKQGENLAIELFDPSMSVKELREMLDPYVLKTSDGVEYVAEEGYAKLFSAITGMQKEYTGLDLARTQAYLATSLSGQISDIAEGIRINRGSNSVPGASERLKENIMFLMKLQGVTRHYASKKKSTKTIFERLAKRGIKPDPVVTDVEELPQVLNKIQREVEVFGENLDYLNTYYPKSAEALLELYELSDGKISSISKLNDDIHHSFTRFRPFIDREPDSPNILAQAVRANYYNSMLSSFGTGATALYGNLSGLIAEPVSYFAGAALRWDVDAIQRGWMAYSAIFDTQRKALPYAGKMFMKASQNPNSVKGQTRLDLVFKQEQKIAQYKKIAEEQAAQGNLGFKYLVDFYENQMHMAQDPVFRFIPNAMTGFDGLTGAMLANAEARFKAMSELKRLGKDITRDEVKRLADIEYNKMFNEDGIIVDEAVKYSTGNVALNLESELVKNLDGLLKVLPAGRLFLLFPGIMANVVKQFDNYMPLPLKSFQQDINDLAFTKIEDIASNPELLDNLLTKRGVQVNQMDEAAKLDKFVELQSKTLGRKAIGSFVVGTITAGMFLNQFELTGDGFYDRSTQRSRQENSDWERRTFRLKAGGPRIHYDELLGPGLANWVAMVANVADNFDSLGEAQFENLREKLAFILAGSLTDPMTSAISPLMEMLNGNTAAMDRFAAGHINSLGPLGGLRNEMGRVIDGGLKIVEQDMLSALANLNQLIGVFDPVNRLPDLYSPVTGKIPNKYTLMQRAWNAVSPIKISPEQSTEEKFLQDIEFDVASSFKQREGIELNARERSELFRIMGEQGYFKSSINRISKTAQARNTIQRLREARMGGVKSTQLDLKDFDIIHYQLGIALRDAEKLAFGELDSNIRTGIDARILAARQQKEQARMGVIPDVESTLNIRR